MYLLASKHKGQCLHKFTAVHNRHAHYKPHHCHIFYRLIDSIHPKTHNLTVCGFDNKIYNYFPHFDCHDNK